MSGGGGGGNDDESGHSIVKRSFHDNYKTEYICYHYNGMFACHRNLRTYIENICDSGRQRILVVWACCLYADVVRRDLANHSIDFVVFSECTEYCRLFNDDDDDDENLKKDITYSAVILCVPDTELFPLFSSTTFNCFSRFMDRLNEKACVGRHTKYVCVCYKASPSSSDMAAPAAVSFDEDALPSRILLSSCNC